MVYYLSRLFRKRNGFEALPYRVNIVSCLLAMGLLFLLGSCSARRKAIRTPLMLYGTEFLLERLNENEFSPEHLSARFVADAKLDKNRFLFNGHVRLRRDSIIWISASAPLGVELFRMIITPDSIKWLNRMTSDYYIGEFAKVSQKIHPLITFNLLQSLLFGNDLPSHELLQFNSSLDNMEYRLTVANPRQPGRQARGEESQSVVPEHEIWLIPETFRISRMIVNNTFSAGQMIEVRYSEFQKVAGLLFATQQQYKIMNKDQRYNISLVFSKLDTESASGFPFRIPEKYTPNSSFTILQ